MFGYWIFHIKKSFTLIEVLVIIAILLLLGGATTPFLSRFVLKNNFDTTVDKTIGVLRKAQAYSMDGKNDASWGICVINGVLRLYRGACAVPDFSENFSIPTTVAITGINNPGITFSKRGEPSSAVNVTVSCVIASQIIEVNESGGIEIN